MFYQDTLASLSIRGVVEKDSGTYRCEASNDLGSVATSGQLDIQGKLDIYSVRTFIISNSPALLILHYYQNLIY